MKYTIEIEKEKGLYPYRVTKSNYRGVQFSARMETRFEALETLLDIVICGNGRNDTFNVYDTTGEFCNYAVTKTIVE